MIADLLPRAAAHPPRTENPANPAHSGLANGTAVQAYGPNLRGRFVHFAGNERNPTPMIGKNHD